MHEAIEPRPSARRTYLIMLIIGAALVAGCGGKDSSTGNGILNPDGNNNQNPTVSAQMAGVYHVVTTIRDCNTNQEYPGDASDDTLCAGSNFKDALAGAGITPTITKEGDSYRMVWDQSGTDEQGCHLAQHINLVLTYSSSTYNVTGQITTTVQPAGCETYPACLGITVAGTKTGPVPTGACQ